MSKDEEKLKDTKTQQTDNKQATAGADDDGDYKEPTASASRYPY